MIDTSIPLGKLLAGQGARVCRVSGEADHVHRLEEFGLRAGTQIQMFRPGNPCIFRMAGSKVCCRTGDRLHIHVEPH